MGRGWLYCSHPYFVQLGSYTVLSFLFLCSSLSLFRASAALYCMEIIRFKGFPEKGNRGSMFPPFYCLDVLYYYMFLLKKTLENFWFSFSRDDGKILTPWWIWNISGGRKAWSRTRESSFQAILFSIPYTHIFGGIYVHFIQRNVLLLLNFTRFESNTTSLQWFKWKYEILWRGNFMLFSFVIFWTSCSNINQNSLDCF